MDMLTESILLDLAKLVDPLAGSLNHLSGSPALHCIRGADQTKTPADAMRHERAGEFSGSRGSTVAVTRTANSPIGGLGMLCG